MPTLSLARQAMRRRIADKRGDLVFGTVNAGASNVQFTLPAIDQLANATYLQGSEGTVIAAAGTTQTGRVSSHTVASGIATIVVGASTGNVWSIPASGDVAE